MHSTYSGQLQQALENAGRLSKEMKLNCIDTGLILSGILQTNIDLPNGIDRQYIISKIDDSYKNIPTPPPPGDGSLPFTIDTNYMMNNASAYLEKTGDAEVSCAHVILSILSFENLYRELLSKQGFVFYEAVQHFFGNTKNTVEIKKIHPRHVPRRQARYSKFQLLFFSKKKKWDLIADHIYEIQLLFRFHDYENCRKVCRQVLQLSPGNEKALLSIGHTYLFEKKYTAALEVYSSIKSPSSLQPDILAPLAFCYDQIGNYTEAEKNYTEVLRVEPANAIMINNLGFALSNQGKYEQAIDLYDQAISLDPGFAYPYNNKGFCCLKSGRTIEARGLIVQSLELDKGNSYAYKNLALVCLEEGKKEEAIALLHKALQYEFTEKYGNEVNDILHQLGQR